MPAQHRVLRRAMNILGARSVTVTSVTSGTVLWSAGETQTDEPLRMGEPSGHVSEEPDPAKVVTAAGKLVALTGSGDEIDDILATSASWFHVFRMVPGGADGGDGYIVHLVLDRARANLAGARHEFRDLVNADRAGGAAVSGTGRKRRVRAAAHQPVQAPAGLPRRVPGQSWSVQSVEVSFPAWFAPDDDERYAVDKLTLDRVMDGLRRLA